MESEFAATKPTPGEAAFQLARVTAMQQRMRSVPARRALALFGVWSAIALAAYMLVFLLAWPGSGGSYQPGLLLVPVLLFSVLIRGMLARGGARFRLTGAGWGVVVASSAILVATLVVSLTSELPVYARVSIPVLLLVVQGVPALVVLRRTEPASSRGVRDVLTPGARFATIGTGVLMAATLATAPWPVASGVATLATMILVFVGVLAEGQPWGLAPAGAQWGAWQWGAFAGVAALQAGVVLLMTLTTRLSPMIAAVAAAVAVATMTVAALRPGSYRGEG